MKPEFLLDECIENKIDSSSYIHATKIVKMGTSDHVLLDKAIERNLTVITQDIRFVLYAIQKGINIVYQDQNGERYYIYGSKTEKMKEKGNPTKYFGGAAQKRSKLLAQYTSSNISMNGFSSVFSF